MNKTLIAVPAFAPGGMDAQISVHFGHSDLFTLVEVDNGQVTRVDALPAFPKGMAVVWFRSNSWPIAESES